MNPAPAHLEAKLRFFELTVGQIAAAILGVLVAFFWAQYLSPLHGLGAAISGAYIGGLPVAAAFVASQTEFDLWTFVFSALRWRRAEARFLPGPGASNRGYVLLRDAQERHSADSQVEGLDADALWGEL